MKLNLDRDKNTLMKIDREVYVLNRMWDRYIETREWGYVYVNTDDYQEKREKNSDWSKKKEEKKNFFFRAFKKIKLKQQSTNRWIKHNKHTNKSNIDYTTIKSSLITLKFLNSLLPF